MYYVFYVKDVLSQVSKYKPLRTGMDLIHVLGGGLEPPRLAAYAPQTYVSAISPPEPVQGHATSIMPNASRKRFKVRRRNQRILIPLRPVFELSWRVVDDCVH